MNRLQSSQDDHQQGGSSQSFLIPKTAGNRQGQSYTILNRHLRKPQPSVNRSDANHMCRENGSSHVGFIIVSAEETKGESCEGDRNQYVLEGTQLRWQLCDYIDALTS